jgi:predicted amidohydrolase YtcJ
MKTLYRNGAVVTMDGAVGTVDAFLVEHGRFVAVGAEAHEIGSGCEVVDLGGRTVVPGLIDAHAHLETDALSRARWVDVRDVPLDVTLDRLRAHAATLKPGEWIVGQATFGQDRGMPDRIALDAAVPDHPVLLRASMHAMTANTRAMEMAGLYDRKFVPTPTVIVRDDDGLPTGQMLEAHHLFPIPAPGVDELAGIIEDGIRENFNRYGVTTIYEVPMSSQGMRAFQQLDRTDRLTARISLNPAVKPGLQPLVDDIEQLATLGLASGFGNDRLWFGGAKFFLDSVYEKSFSAARDVEHPGKWGVLTHRYDEVVRALVIGHEAGIQLWFHALGEGAQRLVIDAATEARRLYGLDGGLRIRIEHIFNDYAGTQEMYDQLRAANLIPVPNAVFIHFYDESGGFPYRTLLEQGFMPPGNSDNSGTQPFADNPWFGIAKMRTRRNKFGVGVAPDQAISVHDGLRTYTEFGAYAGHREGRLGVIREGAFADFAVLNADPFTIAEDELQTVESELTVLGGRVVWEA